MEPGSMEYSSMQPNREANIGRIKSLLTSGQGEAYSFQVLSEILQSNYGVPQSEATKSRLQELGTELFRDTLGNREWNPEQMEAVANRVMDILEQVAREQKDQGQEILQNAA